jgi:hypothetical protein
MAERVTHFCCRRPLALQRSCSIFLSSAEHERVSDGKLSIEQRLLTYDSVCATARDLDTSCVQAALPGSNLAWGAPLQWLKDRRLVNNACRSL